MCVWALMHIFIFTAYIFGASIEFHTNPSPSRLVASQQDSIHVFFFLVVCCCCCSTEQANRGEGTGNFARKKIAPNYSALHAQFYLGETMTTEHATRRRCRLRPYLNGICMNEYGGLRSVGELSALRDICFVGRWVGRSVDRIKSQCPGTLHANIELLFKLKNNTFDEHTILVWRLTASTCSFSASAFSRQDEINSSNESSWWRSIRCHKKF